MKRIKITEKLEDDVNICGSLEEIEDKIKNFKTVYNNYANLNIQDDITYDDHYFTLYGTRLETDIEYEKRKNQLKKEKQKN